MGEASWTEYAKDRLDAFAKYAVTLLIDAAFLALWGLTQYGLQIIFQMVQPSGFDEWVLSFLRLAFAVSTVSPIVLWIYGDIRIMYLEIQNRIQRAESDLIDGTGGNRE